MQCTVIESSGDFPQIKIDSRPTNAMRHFMTTIRSMRVAKIRATKLHGAKATNSIDVQKDSQRFSGRFGFILKRA